MKNILWLQMKKKKLQKEDRTFLLQMRSLKQFKFNQKKYSIEFRTKILEFTMLANADEKLNILDEETVREYDTLLENIKIDNKMKYYIEKDTYTMFLRNYTFYNHDYMSGYTSITNMKRIETFDEKAFDFLLSRLYLTLELAFTEDGLGKENTPVYYALIKTYVSKVLKEIKNDDFLKIEKKILKLEESLKWFKISENRFINFGDDNNYKISHKNFITGQKHFKESGYFIYNSKNNTSFRLKYKTLSVMHTHCDDGSFIYTYEGQPIFIDPGLYKYEEKNSIRKYIRSYLGHTNISVVDKDFDAQKINSEIRKQSTYKNFASDSFGKIKVIKDDWETEKKIKIQNNWFENIKINQNIEIKEENEIELTYKIISEITPKISILFNLDDIFNEAKIEFINNCELFVIHNKYKIQFKFSKKVDFTEKNGYKSYSLEEIIKIKKLIFYRNAKELNEEIKLNIKVTKSSLQEKNETEIIQGEKINYIYKKNNYKKLIIIFQSWSYTKEEIDRIIKDKVFRNSFQKKNSTKYSYYYFTKEKNLKADLLYIEENNSYVAGWYILSKGENVVKKYNIFLDQFIKKISIKKKIFILLDLLKEDMERFYIVFQIRILII